MILLYQGVSPVSRAIRFRSWTDKSHAAWAEKDLSGFGQEFAPIVDSPVIEAWHKGGVLRHESIHDNHTPGTVIIVFGITGLTQGERDGVTEFMRGECGKKYDYMGVLHFITRRPEYRRDQDRWFCSELVFAAFVHIKKPLLLRIPAWKVHPGLLAYSPLLYPVMTIVVDRRRHETQTGDIGAPVHRLLKGEAGG